MHSDQRIRNARHGRLTFRWKACRRKETPNSPEITVEAVRVKGSGDLLRRFLLHVLPPGFPRIRHYGFISNRNRPGDAIASLTKQREQLAVCPKILLTPCCLIRYQPASDSNSTTERSLRFRSPRGYNPETSTARSQTPIALFVPFRPVPFFDHRF